MPPVPERLFVALARACALVVVAVPLAVVIALVWSAGRALFALHSVPNDSGLFERAIFTVAAAAVAAATGGGVGVGCAIAAEELAPGIVRGAIGVAIGFIGATPAVVFGWFAAAVASRVIVGGTGAVSTSFWVACAVLAVMVAPTACMLTTRALRRIPDTVRHAAAASGANRLQTTALVVIPALRRKIGAATLAAFARATGEATALQILFAAIARYGGSAPATVASKIFSIAAFAPTGSTAGQLAPLTLVLCAVSLACAMAVAREYRGLQWA